jgi:signal transduction histidine kinase
MSQDTPRRHSLYKWGKFIDLDLERDFDLWNSEIGLKARRRMGLIFLLFGALCTTVELLLVFGPHPNFNGSPAIGVVNLVLIFGIVPPFFFHTFHLVFERDDRKFAVHARNHRLSAFLMFALWVPAMCFYWVQLYLGHPSGSNVQFVPDHPFTFRVAEAFSILGQLLMQVIGSLVYFGVFRPPVEWAFIFTCWSFAFQLSLLLYITNGFTSISSGFAAIVFLFELLALLLMLNWQFTLDETKRELFVHARDLQNSLDFERTTQSLRADIAQEQGRAKAERLITAFLCHEIRNPMVSALVLISVVIALNLSQCLLHSHLTFCNIERHPRLCRAIE